MTKLDPADAAALHNFNAKRQGLAAFIEQVTTAGEKRNAALIEEGRSLWSEIGKKYNLDLEHVSYDVRGDELVPLMQRFE